MGASGVDEIPVFLLEVAEVIVSLPAGQGEEALHRLLHVEFSSI